MIADAQALAERAGTPAEAAAAATKVQQLLLRHNLDMASVRSNGHHRAQAEATEGFQRETFDVGSTTAWLTEWKQDLLYHVAINNGCRAVYYKGGTSGSVGKVWVVGEPHNVATVGVIQEFLVKAIQRLAVEGWKEAKRWTGSHERKWKASFYEGAVWEIGRRLKASRQETEQQAAAESADGDATSALIVSEQARVDEAFYSFYPHHRPAPPLTEEEKEARRQKALERQAAGTTRYTPSKEEQKRQKRREYNRRRYEEKHGYQGYRERPSRTDWGAWEQGRDAAKDINLDSQVGE
jgi:hypothetical protein